MNISITTNEKTSRTRKSVRTFRHWSSNEEETVKKLISKAESNGTPLTKAFREAGVKLNRTTGAVAFRYYNFNNMKPEGIAKKMPRKKAEKTFKITENLIFATTLVLFQKLSQKEKLQIITSSL